MHPPIPSVPSAWSQSVRRTGGRLPWLAHVAYPSHSGTLGSRRCRRRRASFLGMPVQVMIMILGEVGGQILGHAREPGIALIKAFRGRLLLDRRHLHLRSVGKVGVGRENDCAVLYCPFVAHGLSLPRFVLGSKPSRDTENGEPRTKNRFFQPRRCFGVIAI